LGIQTNSPIPFWNNLKTRDKSFGFFYIFSFGESSKINALEIKEVNLIGFFALLFIVY